jgi:hypothetical protein
MLYFLFVQKGRLILFIVVIAAAVHWLVYDFMNDPAMKDMLSESLVTTAWRVLTLRMEEMTSRYGG